jgi:hypothetical protein
MPVDLQELLMGEQAHSLARMSSDFDNLAGLQDRTFLRQITSVDLIEAAAAKELGKAGLPTDLAGIRGGANTPPLPTQGK